MKKAIEILATMVWATVGMLIFATAYALIATQFEGRSFWDLERSLGGFTIHITRNTSMDVLFFRVLLFTPYLALWSALLLSILKKIGNMMPNQRVVRTKKE